MRVQKEIYLQDILKPADIRFITGYSHLSVKFLRWPLLLLLFGSIFWSCSVKKNTVFSRTYHGTTTHYNFYFNARERMKQGAATLAGSHEDKYDRVLSVFRYGTLEQAKAVFPDMDEAIKKASIAITRHSINVKGKKDRSITEHNPWIPECYLVVGQCQFYKHDYWTAIETFQFMSSEYKNDEIRPEALLWLIKSYLGLGKTTDAEYLLDYLKADKKFPNQLRGHYNAVLAQYHLMKNDVPRAMEALKQAAANTKKKDDRARYYFILGQLYQRSDTLSKAFYAYQNVLKLNPPYEMAFNARISRARCYDVGSGSGEAVKRELMKMLKDIKNEEYKDQIYYALGGVARQEKNEDLAVQYLNQSLRASTTNNTQKALSYIELADIYLDRPEYIPAAAYYDSCLSNLTNDHPDYLDIQAKRNSLDRLVKNLKIIMNEDSLQRLAALPESERVLKITQIVDAEDAEKDRQKKEQEEKQRMEEQEIQEEKELQSQPRAINAPQIAATGAWYFYNQSAISFGFNEFLKRWGNRKLEDNWRRSEKEMAISETETGPAEDTTATQNQAQNDSIAKLDAKARKDAYLGKLPVTAEAISESNLRIAEAYYNCGVIYREQLNDFPESIKSFETLDQRFPENKFKLPCYYNLYRTHLALGDTAKAGFYKNYLLSNHPESDYARLIQNPNFYKEMQRKSQVLEVFYENTYRAFINRQYADVIERKSMADEMFPANNKLAPKFALLKAMAVGKTRPLPDFKFELEEVIRRYPKDSASVKAQDLLDYITGKNIRETAIDTVAVDTMNLKDPFAKAVNYTFEQNSLQFFTIIYPKGELNAGDLMNKLRSFNSLNFRESNLTVTSGNIDLSLQYIAVMSFGNKDDALSYYETVISEEGMVTNFDPEKVKFFIISQDNLSELTRTKDLKAYSQFFQKNYLQ
jgi:tetratricopeptide (TPR) repeat protein